MRIEKRAREMATARPYGDTGRAERELCGVLEWNGDRGCEERDSFIVQGCQQRV